MKSNKRSAETAFGEKRSSFLSKHRASNPKASNGGNTTQSTGAKTVDFHDGQDNHDGDDHDNNSRSTFEKAPSDARRQNKSGSLKQRAQELLSVRQKLPIYAHAEAIRQKLRDHDVLLLVGETGSGKSTQIPQFLVTESWCQRKTVKSVKTKTSTATAKPITKTDGKSEPFAVGGCIAITQPRRVAAISLARRVAEEMGTPLGNASPASLVGYSVRFEHSTSPSTRIKFLTEGMLLQEMLRDPWLKEYSAVVVDEVHERGVNVDLVLGFLQRLQQGKGTDGVGGAGDGRGGVPLKVVVMSATADMEKIQDFFSSKTDETGDGDGASQKSVNGSNSKIEEDDEEWDGFDDKPDDNKDPTKTKPLHNISSIKTSTSKATSLYIKGRQHPVKINYTPTPVPDILDAAYQRIIHIHTSSPLPGDVLVFLTGQETVESLLHLLTSYSHTIAKDLSLSRTLPKLLLLPLYAALPSTLQQRVFSPTPKFTRKIILSTNIAETSITVPGIRHVIDTGKAKQRLFRPSLNLDTLLTVPISRSSANQRSGRAGRDAPGTAWRLYTEADFWTLAQDTQPEILRCDLSQLALTLKAHGIDHVHTFPFLTEPPARALERALVHLLQLSALDPSTGSITPLGREMSVLPLPANLARVLLASTSPEYGCVDEIVDIVSALSVENVFLNIQQHSHPTTIDNAAATTRVDNAQDHDPTDPSSSSNHESTAQTLRRQLYRREGDHLTLLATMQAYANENSDRKRWCAARFISHRAMSGAMDVRKQLLGIMARYTSSQRRRKGKGIGNADRAATGEAGDGDQGAMKTDTTRTTNTTTTTTTTTTTAATAPHDPTTLPRRILQCLLTGFHTNVARLSHDGSYRTLLTNQVVAIHPSSVLFAVPNSGARGHGDDDDQGGGGDAGNGNGRRRNGAGAGGGVKKFEAIMYNEFVYTGTKAYARGVSAVEMGWVADAVRVNSTGS